MDVSCMARGGKLVVLVGLDDWRLAKERRDLDGFYSSHQAGSGSVVLLMRAERIGFGGVSAG